MSVRGIISRHRIEWVSLLRLTLLLALALAIPNIGLPQAITGPLVNALLLLTVEWAGVGQAVAVGLASPLSALLRGVLPLPLAVMIPFIMLGNAALVTVYGRLRGKSHWVALGVAATCKFALLYTSVAWLVVKPLALLAGDSAPAYIPAATANMMRWPQLVTALVGGLIAFGVLWASARKKERARP
jgi:hypothetical protein